LAAKVALVETSHPSDMASYATESFTAAAAEYLAEAFRGGNHSRRVKPAGLPRESFDRPGHTNRSDDLA